MSGYFGRKMSCGRLVDDSMMQKEDACQTCTGLMEKSPSTVKRQYKSRAKVPCDVLDGTAAAATPPSPASTLSRACRPRADEGQYAESALAKRSGPDADGYTAEPAAAASSHYGARGRPSKMNTERQTAQPKPTTAASKRAALETLSGGPVNIGRGGQSVSAANKAKASNIKIVSGMAATISPKDPSQGFKQVEDAARTARERYEKEQRQQADKKAREEKAAKKKAEAAAAAAAAAAEQREEEEEQRMDQEQQQPGPAGGCRCSSGACRTSPFQSVLDADMTDTAGDASRTGDEEMGGDGDCTGCNGWLPTVAEFKSYFSSLGQKRKKKSGKSAADDDNEPPKKKPKTTNTDG